MEGFRVKGKQKKNWGKKNNLFYKHVQLMLYMLQPAAAFDFQVLVIRVTIYFEDSVIRLFIIQGNTELARTDRSMYICVSDDIKRRLTKKEAAAILSKQQAYHH